MQISTAYFGEQITEMIMGILSAEHRFAIELAWFDFKLFFDTFLNIFDSLPNWEFDFIKTTCGATIYNFDLTSSAIVFSFRPSHLISYELDFASYEYDLTSCDLVLTSYEFDLIYFEFVLTYEVGLTFHKFDVTSDDFELKMVSYSFILMTVHLLSW